MTDNIVEVTCKWRGCRQKFIARIADRKRGWAKFCSKSCKAKEQESRTGQYAAFLAGGGGRDTDHEEAMRAVEDGWQGHKEQHP